MSNKAIDSFAGEFYLQHQVYCRNCYNVEKMERSTRETDWFHRLFGSDSNKPITDHDKGDYLILGNTK